MSIAPYLNKALKGDCLQLMKGLPNQSIDLILCDLPYGTTQNKWDTVIPFDPLFKEYNRVIKDNGVIALSGQSLFTVDLIAANRKYYRYTVIWEKTKAGGFLNAKRMPLQAHEDIAVFYKKLPTYNPQMVAGKPYTKTAVTDGDGANYGKFSRVGTTNINDGTRYPRSVIRIANDNHGSIHPTQKPVELFEWLIKTYSNPGDIVLDNCAGSHTTAIAALNTGRNFICMEMNDEYHKLGQQRIADHLKTIKTQQNDSTETV